MPDEIMKEYLGDAVYVHHDGWQIWLTTGDGFRNRIALEPSVWDRLMDWRKRVEKQVKEQADGQKSG
jgi:hypothetical protein